MTLDMKGHLSSLLRKPLDLGAPDVFPHSIMEDILSDQWLKESYVMLFYFVGKEETDVLKRKKEKKKTLIVPLFLFYCVSRHGPDSNTLHRFAHAAASVPARGRRSGAPYYNYLSSLWF